MANPFLQTVDQWGNPVDVPEEFLGHTPPALPGAASAPAGLPSRSPGPENVPAAPPVAADLGGPIDPYGWAPDDWRMPSLGAPALGLADPPWMARPGDERPAEEPTPVSGAPRITPEGDQEQLIRERGDLEADLAEKAAARQTEALKENERLLNEDLTARKEEDAKAEKWGGELRADVEAVANAQIDPQRLYKNKSTGQKIATALAAALGGFLAPLQGGRNPAMELIQAEIDRDIRAQEQDLANARSGLGAKQSLYEQYLAKTGDARKAREFTRAAMWDHHIKGLENEKLLFDAKGGTRNKYDALIVEARAAQQAGIAKALEEKRKADLEEREQTRKEFEAKSEDRKRRQDSALGWANHKQSKIDSERRFALDLDKAQRDGSKEEAAKIAEQRKLGVFVPGGGFVKDDKGQPVLAPTEKEAQELRATTAAADTMISGLDRLSEIYSSVGWSPQRLGADQAQEAESILEDIKVAYAVAQEQGAISDGDRASYDRIWGKDATGFISVAPKWQAMRDRMVGKVNHKIRNLTGQSATWGPKPKDHPSFNDKDTPRSAKEAADEEAEASRKPPMISPGIPGGGG